MRRMLWVMMGMCVRFDAPSVTVRSCPCVTSVSYTIVWSPSTRTHVTK